MRVLVFLIAILSLNSCFKKYEGHTYKYNNAATTNLLSKKLSSSSDDEWEQAGAAIGLALVGPMLEQQMGGSYIKPTAFGLKVNITANGQGEMSNVNNKKEADRVVIYQESGDSLVFNYDKDHDNFKLDLKDDNGDGFVAVFTKEK